ncbi:hypothetical protein MPH_14048 [Macrophomina phaseolina MS6]|uniref:Uncharacterized protein n=1 Tax=Macrophomina phaseolina (strain MS6) TaxID=1126212 RepID=K2R474_MACPH|nr:hypothetical protein MPH_14048 [Macrophomina phaseolina MS6]
MASEAGLVVDQAPTVASWPSEEAEKPSFFGLNVPDPSSQALLTIRSIPNDNAASMILRIPAGLKSTAQRVPLFLNIPLENVISLRKTMNLEESKVPEAVRSSFIRDGICLSCQDIIRLEFALARPACAVVPRSDPLVPKTKASSNALQSLILLARALSFTLFIPSHGVFLAALDTICRQVQDGAMKSILNDTRVETFYGGKGGKVIAPGTPPPESPPSYDEIAVLPEPNLYQSKASQKARIHDTHPAKRRKRRSLHTKDPQSNLEQQMAALTQTVDTIRQQMDGALTSHSTPAAEDQLQALRSQLSCVQQGMASLRSQMEASEERVRVQLDDFRAEMVKLLDERLEERLNVVGDDLRNEIEEVADGLNEVVDVRIDDRLMTCKEELMEHVEDELRTAQRRLRGDLMHKASFYVEFDEECSTE